MSILRQSKEVAEFIKGMDIQQDLEEIMLDLNRYGSMKDTSFLVGEFKLKCLDDDDEREVVQIQIKVTRNKYDFFSKEVSNG